MEHHILSWRKLPLASMELHHFAQLEDLIHKINTAMNGTLQIIVHLYLSY